MSSKRHSEEAEAPLAWRVVTTTEDVRALRRVEKTTRPQSLERMDQLAPSNLFPVRRSQRTSKGWEPFRL